LARKREIARLEAFKRAEEARIAEEERLERIAEAAAEAQRKE